MDSAAASGYFWLYRSCHTFIKNRRRKNGGSSVFITLCFIQNKHCRVSLSFKKRTQGKAIQCAFKWAQKMKNVVHEAS